jgi:hypothetical protein
MSHVTTKVASTLLIGVAAAAVSTALPLRFVNAADSCLTEPKGDVQGKHWYYHIERGTGRHCWYQRGENEKSAGSDDDKQAASDKAPPSDVDTATARSFAEAHAEIAPKAVKPASTNAAAAPSVWPAPPAPNAPAASNAPASDSAPAQAAAQDSSLASRWPQQPADAAPSPPQQPEASLMVADAQDNTTAAADAPPPPPPVAAPPERQIGSIQKLLLVAFGALTLAGLTGSAVYRFGRRRRRNDWLRERNAWQEAQNPNRPPWVDEPRLHSNLAVADLDEPHPDELRSDLSPTMSETEAGGERVEKIEEFLARLTLQLQEEMEGTRPHNAA